MLRYIAAYCGILRRKRRNMPRGAARHCTAKQHNATGVNELLAGSSSVIFLHLFHKGTFGDSVTSGTGVLVCQIPFLSSNHQCRSTEWKHPLASSFLHPHSTTRLPKDETPLHLCWLFDASTNFTCFPASVYPRTLKTHTNIALLLVRIVVWRRSGLLLQTE